MSEQRTVFARPQVEVSPVHLLNERTKCSLRSFFVHGVFVAKPWSSLSQFQNCLTFKVQHVLSSSLFLKTNHIKQNLVKQCIVLLLLVVLYTYSIKMAANRRI